MRKSDVYKDYAVRFIEYGTREVLPQVQRAKINAWAIFIGITILSIGAALWLNSQPDYPTILWLVIYGIPIYFYSRIKDYSNNEKSLRERLIGMNALVAAGNYDAVCQQGQYLNTEIYFEMKRKAEAATG